MRTIYLKWFDRYESIRVVYYYFVMRNGGQEFVDKYTLATTYVQPVADFISFHGYNDPDRFLMDVKDGKIDLTDAIVKWRHKLIREGRAPKSIHRWNSGLKKWLELNDIVDLVNWNVVKRKTPLPVYRTITEDRIPTRDELRCLILNANIRMRALLMVAATSGIRIGALLKLKLKDVDFKSYDDIAIIRVRPELSKNKRGYYTLITSEARNVLMQYLEWRKSRGEILTDDSWLFSSRDPSKPMKYKTALVAFLKLLERCGLKQKTDRSHIHEIHIHTLRKWFRTQLEGYLTKSEIMRLMGQYGRSGESYLDGAYFRPLEKELINKYRLAQHRLAIMKTEMPTEEKKNLVKSVLKSLAPIIGLKEFEIDEIIKRSKDLDDLAKNIQSAIKLKKFGVEANGGIRTVKIISDDEELIRYLEMGWEIVRELRDGRVIVRKPP